MSRLSMMKTDMATISVVPVPRDNGKMGSVIKLPSDFLRMINGVAFHPSIYKAGLAAVEGYLDVEPHAEAFTPKTKIQNYLQLAAKADCPYPHHTKLAARYGLPEQEQLPRLEILQSELSFLGVDISTNVIKLVNSKPCLANEDLPLLHHALTRKGYTIESAKDWILKRFDASGNLIDHLIVDFAKKSRSAATASAGKSHRKTASYDASNFPRSSHKNGQPDNDSSLHPGPYQKKSAPASATKYHRKTASYDASLLRSIPKADQPVLIGMGPRHKKSVSFCHDPLLPSPYGNYGNDGDQEPATMNTPAHLARSRRSPQYSLMMTPGKSPGRPMSKAEKQKAWYKEQSDILFDKERACLNKNLEQLNSAHKDGLSTLRSASKETSTLQLSSFKEQRLQLQDHCPDFTSDEESEYGSPNKELFFAQESYNSPFVKQRRPCQDTELPNNRSNRIIHGFHDDDVCLSPNEKSAEASQSIASVASVSPVKERDEATLLRDDSLMCQQLQQQGWEVHEVPGDGNCLFHAIISGMHEHGLPLEPFANHKYLRRCVCDELAANQQHYGEFGLERDHINSMRLDGAYAGHPELVVAAKLLNRGLLQGNKVKFQVFTYSNETSGARPMTCVGDEGAPHLIALFYRRGNHYDLLLPLESANVAPVMDRSDLPGNMSPDDQSMAASNSFFLKNLTKAAEDDKSTTSDDDACNSVVGSHGGADVKPVMGANKSDIAVHAETPPPKKSFVNTIMGLLSASKGGYTDELMQDFMPMSPVAAEKVLGVQATAVEDAAKKLEGPDDEVPGLVASGTEETEDDIAPGAKLVEDNAIFESPAGKISEGDIEEDDLDSDAESDDDIDQAPVAKVVGSDEVETDDKTLKSGGDDEDEDSFDEDSEEEDFVFQPRTTSGNPCKKCKPHDGYYCRPTHKAQADLYAAGLN